MIYQGPVAPIELIPDAGQGFFASSLPYRFRLKARTAGSLEFSADGPGGLTVTKKFVLSADGGINSFSMDITNKGRTPQILPAWELTVGPGLGTAKSEEKENPKLWRAAYAFMETGRKHQIRAHALWLGHAVVGDKLYGPDERLYLEFAQHGWTERHAALLPLSRQALHCASQG